MKSLFIYSCLFLSLGCDNPSTSKPKIGSVELAGDLAPNKLLQAFNDLNLVFNDDSWKGIVKKPYYWDKAKEDNALETIDEIEGHHRVLEGILFIHDSNKNAKILKPGSENLKNSDVKSIVDGLIGSIEKEVKNGGWVFRSRIKKLLKDGATTQDEETKEKIKKFLEKLSSSLTTFTKLQKALDN